MGKPFILHILTPEKNPSPYDVNMALDAGWDSVMPYTRVQQDEVQDLVQDAIFSRGPSGVKHTGIFIGGRDIFTALKMLDTAKKSMMPPFEVSVFADPSGAFTTAAGMVALATKHLVASGGLGGKRVMILGGTGPVGMATAVLAMQAGAEVILLSRSLERAQLAVDRCTALAADAKNIKPGDDNTKQALIASTQIMFAAPAAGIQLINEEEILLADNLQIAADVNAVPPVSIAGIEPQHDGVVIAGSPSGALGIGALAVGNVKYQAQHRLLKQMRETDKPVYLDYKHACETACAYVSES